MDKKILYIGGFNFFKQNASSIRVIENARFFNLIGYKTLVLGKAPLSSHLNDVLIKNIEIGYDNKKIDFTINIESVKKNYYDLAKNSNNVVIIAYNYPPIAFSKILKFCKKNKIKLIPDITEWYGIDGKLTLNKSIRWLLTQWRMRILTPKCENIILASHKLIKRYTKNNILLLPFVTIDNSVITKEKKKLSSKYIFTYSGSPGLNFSKDRLDIIIQAFSKLDNTNFLLNIVGLSKELMLSEKKVKEQIIQLKNKIVFYGRVTNKESIKVIQNSDFVIFARDINRVNSVGYPTKVFEAFKYGIPVITNNTSDLSLHIINNENGFLIEDASVNLFAKKINNILNLPTSKILKLKENCINDNPFFYKKYIKTTINFLNN